jgi:hypothetical protein
VILNQNSKMIGGHNGVSDGMITASILAATHGLKPRLSSDDWFWNPYFLLSPFGTLYFDLFNFFISSFFIPI